MLKRRSRKAGMAPGTLVHIGQQKVENVSIQVTDYDAENLVFTDNATVAQAVEAQRSLAMTWVNVQGIHDIALLEQLGEGFGIHRLVLEDILNTDQRPKCETIGNGEESNVFLVLKTIAATTGSDQHHFVMEQLSMIVGKHYVMTFLEHPDKIFDGVCERLKTGKNKLRKGGSDYLAYALMDTVVDRYFLVLEQVGDRVELMQERILDDPDIRLQQDIHTLRQEMILFRKAIWPLREVVQGFLRNETLPVQKDTRPYLHDLYDHSIQIIEIEESFRDLLESMMDLYLSSLSFKMNNIMKMLTIIATIFIPLTFLVGVYGMNFKYMPELNQPWAYPTLWIIMIAMAVSMLVYFRKKDWF
ncbi:MAG: magnesium/cobalt transporter CorA [Candidatus Melainabacteria bacterium]